jgi:hypothetical protein
MAKKHTRRVSLFDAIALHAEANKSDPFAAKRMAMTLRNRNDKPKEVHAEATRLIASRAASIHRNGAEWLKPEQEDALATLKLGLIADRKPKRGKRQHLSMSQFVSKADLEAARAA